MENIAKPESYSINMLVQFVHLEWEWCVLLLYSPHILSASYIRNRKSNRKRMHELCDKHMIDSIDRYYEIRKSRAFSLSLSNFSSASEITCSSKPKSSSSPKRIKCSIIWKSRTKWRNEKLLLEVNSIACRLDKFLPVYRLFPIFSLFSPPVLEENPLN